MPTPYTAEVGRKFHADGSPASFAGTTVISFVDVAAPIARMGTWLQEEIRQQPFADKFSILPPSSFHMTVIQLLNDQDRTPQRWTPHLALATPMDKICSFMGRRQGLFSALLTLQAELIKLQDWVQAKGENTVVIFAGQDSAGKGGVIKRISNGSTQPSINLKLTKSSQFPSN
ncbi:MAG: DUF1868 domain-containing protein, partial [Caldilineaceae bacterium]|nr:DUF1868 domain-containing protein [Caldilineaceae bacterium]